MDKWIVGLQQNQKVDYIVNYEVSHFSSSQKSEAIWNINVKMAMTELNVQQV